MPFQRALIIDHRRVDLEHRPGAQRRGGEDAFAAEVVVPLDDGVGREYPARDAPRRAVAPSAAPSGRAAAAWQSSARDPRESLVARRDERVHFVPERGEPFGNRT